MNLETQIQSLIVSFVYGLFYSLIYNIFYAFLYCNNKILRIITNLVFNVSLTILFFYIMYLINYGNIHIYFIIFLLLGFFIGDRKTVLVRTHFKPKKRE